MSEHRRAHTYPVFTMTADAGTDYFTVVLKDEAVVYENNTELLAFHSEQVSGAVYGGDTLYYSLKYDYKIYACCKDGRQWVAGVLDYGAIKVLNYINHSDQWLVIEAAGDKRDFTDACASDNETVTLVYDLVNKKVLFDVPMPYLVDMGLPEKNRALLLGEGCEGEIYSECGDGVDEIILRSIQYDGASGQTEILDTLGILSIYDDFTENINSRSFSRDRMRFPLFDKYLYYWLDAASLSAQGKYVVYYSEDIRGIIISGYEDGHVYRVFRAPLPHNDYTQYYFNEATNIFTVIDGGKINRYSLIIQSSQWVEALNDYYDQAGNHLGHDEKFIDLLNAAISGTFLRPER